MQTLVIDTSYGSTVGMVGHDPIVETDSRTHVEKLQVNIATTVEQAGLKPENIDRIIVGIGPAPFTGLRAGIVAAKALAFATGAQLIGQNVLSPQVLVRNAEHDGRHHLTLAVNDARRKQLYFTLLDGSGYEAGGSAGEDHDANVEDGCVETLIDMDIDYPESDCEPCQRGAGTASPGRSERGICGRRRRPWSGEIRAIVGKPSRRRRSARSGAARRGRVRIGTIRGLRHFATVFGESGAGRTVVFAQAGRVGAEPVEACTQPCRRGTHGVTIRHDR